jgi:ubiquinone/menaquinone biosynthesis C-methylase UbiE
VVTRAAACSREAVARVALELLELQPADAVLELGCGSGRLLSALAARLRSGFAAGIDPSELMVRHARMRNRHWIARGRVEVRNAHSGDLRAFPDGRFDKVFGAHVVYFWTEPDRDLAEIRRVLRPGGQLLLGFFPKDGGAGSARFPIERAEPWLRGAGFVAIRTVRHDAGGRPLAWVRGERT